MFLIQDFNKMGVGNEALFGSNLFLLFFLLLNSVYTVLPLSQGLDRVKGGTIRMKTVKYVHTKLCFNVYILHNFSLG